MVGKRDKTPQLNFFSTPLVQFIDLERPICKLAHQIDWEKVEKDFSAYYSKLGAPSIPIRKMVGLIILKQLFNLSDEEVVEQWLENPYWQYFCGETVFQKKYPFDPSDFVHFRKRIGKEGAEKILKLSIDLFGNTVRDRGVKIDTTVQEKNVTFPTDTKLHVKIIRKCQKIANENGIVLRQSYTRTIPGLMMVQRFRKHPKSRKKAHAAARKIKTIAGRLVRELDRKLPDELHAQYNDQLKLFKKILAQKRGSKNKIYSLHEPAVQCIAKGKDHKPYEFGNKSSFVVTSDSGIIVGALAFRNNPYDGHTLIKQLQQVHRLWDKLPDYAVVDRGYKGRNKVLGTEIVIPRKLPETATEYQRKTLRKRCRNRAGIEPVIGHLKSDYRLGRNFLKGVPGDAINTILAAAAFNIRKWITIQVDFFFSFWNLVFQLIFNPKISPLKMSF
ncbi:MAG: IS5 family transposase [Candidatus Atribacteria bacterium]|nr:IS5 family transposase [Candidatus Atribacteria bacterium]